MNVCMHVSTLMHVQMLNVFSEHVCPMCTFECLGAVFVSVCVCAMCGYGCGHALWSRVDVDISYNTGDEEPE